MRFSLFVRMTAPVVTLSALLLILGISTAWYVLRMQQDAHELLTLNVASIRAAEELEIFVREIRTQLNQFLLTGDRHHLSNIPRLRNDTDIWLAEAERLATTQREQELMFAVKRGYRRFFEDFDQISDPVAESARSELRDLINEVLTAEILRPAHDYLEINEQIIQSSIEHGNATAQWMVMGLLLLGTCGPLAGLLAGFAIARSVNQSLVQLSIPVHDAAGKLSEVVGPITVSAGPDIDALEHALLGLSAQVSTVVQRLEQSQREVLRSEQLAAIGQLAAGVAHELRNPLQCIQLLVQAAVDDRDSGCLEGRDLVVLRDAVERVKRSVQMLLDFARPPTLEKRPLRLEQIVRETLELVAGRSRRQGVVIQCDVLDEPVGIGIGISADADQMRQLVLNLLLNALDAVPGKGTVRVELSGPPSGNSAAGVPVPMVRVTVSDTGVGLPAELGTRIFEPFVTTKETGVGLGLPICQRIVEAHGGVLHAANNPDGGARFTVELPTNSGIAPPRSDD